MALQWDGDALVGLVQPLPSLHCFVQKEPLPRSEYFNEEGGIGTHSTSEGVRERGRPNVRFIPRAQHLELLPKGQAATSFLLYQGETEGQTS